MEVLQAAGSVLLLLLGFVAVLVLAYLCTRLVGRQFPLGPGSSGYIQVVDRVPLGQEGALYIVRAGGQLFLLGAAAHSIQLLGTLQEEKLEKSAAQPASVPFAQLLRAARPAQDREKGEKDG